MKQILLTAIFCSLLVGCSGQTVFLVYRDVPTNPSFVVIPTNDYLYQVEFANKIESYIIRSGLKTVRCPASKVVETKKQVTQAQVESKEGQAAEATLTERYYSFDETDADYIVESYADTKQLKIIKKATKEILTVFELNPPKKPFDLSREKDREGYSGDDDEAKLIYQTLKSLGLPVRDKTKE